MQASGMPRGAVALRESCVVWGLRQPLSWSLLGVGTTGRSGPLAGVYAVPLLYIVCSVNLCACIWGGMCVCVPSLYE